MYFTSSPIFKSFDFNFALNNEVSWSSFSGFDRTLFQSEVPLIDTVTSLDL